MTVIDILAARIAEPLSALPRRRVAAFFGVCAIGLRPAMVHWHTAFDEGSPDTFTRGLATLQQALGQTVSREEIALELARVEASVPCGEARAGMSATAAQDCWICLDTALRTLVDTNFDPLPVIEYALQPAVESASERLFGFSDVGSGAEGSALQPLLEDDQLVRGTEFLLTLANRIAASQSVDLEILAVGAEAICP